MGSAIVGGIIKSGFAAAKNITAADIDNKLLQNMSVTYKINTTNSNTQVAKESDVLFLCIKPHIYLPVINEIKDIINPNAIIVTIAAGQTLKAVSAAFGKPLKIVRTMPNTPALVNAGCTAVCPSMLLSNEDSELILSIFKTIGTAELLPEHLFDAFTGVAGSSPAYAFMFIEAMADAGVRYGLSRSQAFRFSAQTLLGSAKMLLQEDMHPGELKDAVCSPGGTTIEAVCVLENAGFRNAVIQAVSACVDKSIKMSE